LYNFNFKSEEYNFQSIEAFKHDKCLLKEIDKKSVNIFSLSRSEMKIYIEIFKFDKKWIKDDIKEINLNNYFKKNSSDDIIDFSLTKTSNFLFIVFNNKIYCLSLTPFVIKFNIDISSINQIKNLEIIPIGNSDNVILFVNKRTLYRIIYSKVSNSVEYFETELNNCRELFVENDLLLVIQEDISIFKLTIKEMQLIFKINGNTQFIQIAPDCHYLALFNEKTLKLFRIKDKELIAEIPILFSVSSMNINNKYVSLGIEGNRVISYIIVDPLNEKHNDRISELEDL